MKSINNEEILDAIYELADEKGMKITDFVEQLRESSRTEYSADLPAEILEELENAKQIKKERRAEQKQLEQNQTMKTEIQRFREVFPEVSPEDIPPQVWDEVADGISLAHAYALYTLSVEKDSQYADEVNKDNSARAASKAYDIESEPDFSKEQVEKMSHKDVKKNYGNILRSIKRWKI